MKFGCTAATLRRWMRQAERDRGLQVGLTMEERDPIKALEREAKVLRHAKEILRKASTNFAQEECGNGIPTRHRGGYSVMPC